MFNLARDWGYSSESNPAGRINQFHEEARERFLSPDELLRVNEALAQEPNEYWRAYFLLSLLIGTRRSESLGRDGLMLILNKGHGVSPNQSRALPPVTVARRCRSDSLVTS